MRRQTLFALALLIGSAASAAALEPRALPAVVSAAIDFAAPAPEVPRVVANLRERAPGADLEAMARAVIGRRAAALGLTAESVLELQAIRHGKSIDVVRFRQTTAGLPVLRGDIAVSFNRRGEAIFIANDLKPLVGDVGGLADAASSVAVAAGSARALALAHLGIAGGLSFDRADLVVFPGADRVRLAWAVRLVPSNRPHGDWEVLVDATTGAFVRVEDLALRGGTGQGHAFLPDPLSSAGATYGDAGYTDGSDADTAQLIAEIFDVLLPEITFTAGAWTLVGPYADCRGQLENPFSDCVTDADGDFRPSPATRLPQAFEEVQDYYHIDTYMRFINEVLGIPLLPTQYAGGVRYDPHGLSGADNSHYIPSTGIIAFGDGGVDDSEDPDVVIHELGHGLHDWLIAGTGVSQVQGLSEGLGDYFAVSYSRTFSGQWIPTDPQYNWVFSWDGHNPFWGGRVTTWNDNHLYPTHLTGQIHTDGQFWSSCNIDVAESIGYLEADQAVIEGIAMTSTSTNQAQAAQAVMQAAAELGYTGPTLSTMLAIYNDSSGGFGCNYNVVSALLIADFDEGNFAEWSTFVP